MRSLATALLAMVLGAFSMIAPSHSAVANAMAGVGAFGYDGAASEAESYWEFESPAPTAAGGFSSATGFMYDPSGFRYATKGADEAAGAIRVVGRHIESVDDVFANPQLLKGRTPQQVEALIGDTAGWQVETLGRGSRQGQGWILREYTGSGNPTGRLIQWHPGGAHHGLQPYWKISSGPTGTVRIFE